MTEISVVIINFNTFQLTCNCLKSVIEKTIDINYEIILVDNASTECDPNIFKELFPEVKLVKSDINLGFSKGNNLGISHAKGNYILLLNSDTILLNNAIKIAHDKIKSNVKIGVLTAKLISDDGSIQHSVHRFPSVKIELLELFRLRFLMSEKHKSNFLAEFADYNKEISCDWVWGTFFLFPRQILAKLQNGILSENFFMYYEDMEWCYHIKKLGYDILYSPDPNVIHYTSSSTKTADQLKLKNQSLTDNFHFILIEILGENLTRIYYFVKGLKHLSFFYTSQNSRAAINYFKLIFR